MERDFEHAGDTANINFIIAAAIIARLDITEHFMDWLNAMDSEALSAKHAEISRSGFVKPETEVKEAD